MRFRYSTTGPAQDESDSLPRVPLVLRSGVQVVDVVGLVDSGATVNVLPYEVGAQLGAVWDDRKANIRLAGALGSEPAIPLFAMAQIGDLPLVRLAFAWVKRSDVPLILGQTNFFMEFDVCFYRSRLDFEVAPKSQP
ncbi:MAG: retroviral-like aspartic protease family protein [Planctomycetes bacterium]|nr:retroviral-like aspartic protease family protein [Planctomycetota bacterium]MBU4398977.1 retroviral-like aspartic protease family protein [Planctomycetota bacterium]MCG2685189.1 retroviral-like aspartic protease family protein [Planctomycetales bacterium]